MKTSLESNIKCSRILITGASGLIGSEVLKRINDNHEIFITDRNSNEIRKEGMLTYLPGDFSENKWLENLPDKMDCILHLAQSEKFRDFPASAVEVFNVNTYSTLMLLDYAKKAGVKKFIYASSGGIYGNSNVGFNEDDPVSSKKDLGFYLGSKFCSEIIADNYSTFFDVNILRFFFVYGKEQKASMLIPRLLGNVINGNEIVLQGNDGIKINPVHVKDAAAAIVKCLNINGSHKINIGGPEVLSLREICEIIGDKVGKKPKFQCKSEEPKNLFGDIDKMKKLLISPEIPFSKGIDELINKIV